jgi:hypothetical protein
MDKALIKEKVFEDFNYIADHANDIFFDSKYNNKPLYLDIEDEMIEDLGHETLLSKNDFIEEVGRVVAETLDWDEKDIYKSHHEILKDWTQNKFSEKPPFTPLLIAFSYAAEIMKTDDNYSANNYFQRLGSILNVDEKKVDKLRNCSKQMEIFWLKLNSWLSHHDYLYGIPTAKPVFKSWKYVSYAISQSLIRDSDRKILRKVFNHFNISEYEKLDSVIYAYLNRWITTTEPSEWIKKLWSKEELQEKICETTLEEFEIWKEEQKETNGNSHKRTTMSWIFEYKEFPEEIFNLYLTTSVTEFEDATLKVSETSKNDARASEKNLYLEPHDDLGFSVVKPYENIKIDQIMNTSIEFEIDQLKLKHDPRPILIFKKLPNGMYQEVNSTNIYTEQAIIVHEKHAPEVKKILEENCLEGFFEMKKNANIQDWHAFLNVVMTKSINTEKDMYEVLSPIAEKVEFIYHKGLNLIQNTWHAFKPPIIYCSDGNHDLNVRLINLGTETEHTVNDLLNSKELDNTNFKIYANDPLVNRNVTSSKEISFRTANFPRAIPPEYDQKIGYLESSKNLYSSSELQNNNSYYISGLKTNIENNVQKNENELEIYKQLKINTIYDPDNKSVNYNKEKANIADENNCILRGYHIFKYPDDPKLRGKNYSGPVDLKECVDCSLVHPIRNKNKNKNNKITSNQNSLINLIINKSNKDNLSADEKNLEIDHDATFDAICYFQAGRYSILKKILEPACKRIIHIKNIIENLIDLGHIDVIKDEDGNIKFWKVCPSVLVVKENEMFISGFRNTKLIDQINEKLKGENRYKLEQAPQENAPSKVLWSSEQKIDIDVVKSSLSDIRNSLGEKLVIDTSPAVKMINFIGDFIDYYNKFPERTVEYVNKEFEKFNTTTGKWELGFVNGKGAYRSRENPRKYYYYDQIKFIYAPHDIVKIKAVLEDKKVVHEYNETEKEFRCLMNTEPPGLYKRALIAESGLIPKIVNKYKIYKNVSFLTGLLTISYLYS